MSFRLTRLHLYRKSVTPFTDKLSPNLFEILASLLPSPRQEPIIAMLPNHDLK